MKNKNILIAHKIPQLWVVCIVLIYGLLLAEFGNTLNSKFFPEQPNVMFSFFITFSYVVMIIFTFVFWLISTFLIHLFAVLFNGNGKYRDFLKYTGLTYAISAIFLLLVIFMVEGVEIEQNDISNMFKENQTMKITSWILNIAGFGYYLLIIPIIKYLYKVNWFKSIGSIVIPFVLIFLLGQFFEKFIL